MKKIIFILIFFIFICLPVGVCSAAISEFGELAFYQQGASLFNEPDYDWWYGCSPTSAGMMMGYYDRNGYDGWSYSNLVPGGTAEPETFPGEQDPDPYPTGWASLANNVIASAGHVADFYEGGNDASGDDVSPPYHEFDSLADFMGTSQDSLDNANGWTLFYANRRGLPLTASDLYDAGPEYYEADGMYGIVEYLAFAGYSVDGPYGAYTQLTDNNPGLPSKNGFSFDDYMAEIDAGRVVMLHVEGHSMFGYGYDVSGSTVLLHDTWSLGAHSMAWGGSYSGLEMWGVTCITPSGSDTLIPAPATILMLGSGLLGIVGIRRKFKG